MYQGQERRKYKRVKKPFMVNFSAREHGPKSAGKKWDMVAVIDIGAGGILFYYNRSIEVGTALDLKVNYSAEKDPVICEGKVIRVLPVPGGEFSLVAVVFEDIDEKERKSLDEVIELVAVNKANAGK